MQVTQDSRDRGSVLGLGRSPGEGNGNPLQYSCLGNPMDRAARWATVHRVTKSWTRLSRYLSFLSMLSRRVSIMGNISLLTKFKKKRSLEVHRHIPFCLFTYMFIKDWERKNKPWHPEAGLVSQQGDVLFLLDVKALTELQLHTGSPWEQEWRRQQTHITASPPRKHPLPWLKSKTAPSLPIAPLSSLWSPTPQMELLRLTLVELTPVLGST